MTGMAWERFVAGFHRFQRRGIRVVQVGLLYPSLFLLYYLGLGFTRILMTILARKTLFHRPPGGRKAATFWRSAEGYGLTDADLTRQS